MAHIRTFPLLVALLLVAVAALAGGAPVRPAPLAPMVAAAPAVPTAPSSLPAREQEQGDVDALLAPDGTLRLDGTFTGAVDLSGWHVTLDPERGPVFHPQSLTYTWENLGTTAGAINNVVRTIAISGNDVYVGGSFTDAGGNPNADRIARWDGSQWHALGSGVSGLVLAIAISGNDVYVGGSFTDAGGVTNANNIARWNGTSWNAVGPTPSINGTVHAIAISGTDVYVGGFFLKAGGVPGANNIARWNSVSNTWNLVGAANAVNSTVRAIKVSGSDVYIGGDFTNAGGNSAADYLVRWDGAQWTALVSGTAGVFGPVYALAVSSSDDVYAGGNFLNTGNNPFADYIARYALATKRVYLPLIVR